MKKRLYIVIISILTIIVVSTAFIPLTNNLIMEKEKSNADVAQPHPELGYVENIGS